MQRWEKIRVIIQENSCYVSTNTYIVGISVNVSLGHIGSEGSDKPIHIVSFLFTESLDIEDYTDKHQRNSDRADVHTDLGLHYSHRPRLLFK